MVRILLLGVVLAAIARADAREAVYSYAGIRVSDQIAEVSRRYPNSRRTAGTIYVSEKDVRDHVYGILISSHGHFTRVRLTFERKLRAADGTRRMVFPTCNSVYQRFAREHGPQTSSQKYYEAMTETHKRIWSAGRETATLLCFKDNSGQWRVEAIEFLWE